MADVLQVTALSGKFLNPNRELNLGIREFLDCGKTPQFFLLTSCSATVMKYFTDQSKNDDASLAWLIPPRRAHVPDLRLHLLS
jgi:hypothetical protein